MASAVVVDASAAVRAVMDPAAQPALLQALAEAPLVLAPGLLRTETANALWKYRRAGVIDMAEAIERHHELLALVHRFEDEQTLYPEALHLACTHDHPVYDAVYVVTARRHGARLVTYDRRLHTLCGLAGVEGELFGA